MKLINKDALVAEIEKRLNYRIESLKTINNGTFWKGGQSEDEFNESLTRCAFNAAKNELFELKCFIDTLDVKEVDLDVMQRMEECPYRQVGCTMYEGKILECRGACAWVVDYLKLKELKAQKGDIVANE